MMGPDLAPHGEPGFSLPAFARLAPPAPPEEVATRIEADSRPGDVVVDLFGRGGWIARAAIDRQRRACSFESSPLTRLLAEVVLRPPDVRHLDAAFQVIATAPQGQTPLRVALDELFATRCATCDRSVVADELIWESDASAHGQDDRLVRKHYRCGVCRDQIGGHEQRNAPPDEADLERAIEIPERSLAWRVIRERFPVLDENTALVDELLSLHTPRQLVGLHAILERIETELRAAPVEAALRLSLLQALLPASRLNRFPGRVATLRIVGGRVKPVAGVQWRERNPWLAFEDGYRLVRGFVQRLEGASGAVQARFREDLRGFAETPSAVLVRLGSPAVIRSASQDASRLSAATPQARVRLVVAQAPLRPSQDRLSLDYFATAWVMGHAAADLLPLAPLFRSSAKLRWGWQAAQLQQTFAAVEPMLSRDARAILLLDDGGPEALVAAVLGVVAAGFRLVAARLDEPGAGRGSVVEFVPPGSVLPPGPRTRANVALPPTPGGAGDPEYVQSGRLFAPPELIGARPFSPEESARAVTDAAVETLRARGEPAGYERLVGEILVALDRAGHLRRMVETASSVATTLNADEASDGAPTEPPTDGHTTSIRAAGADQLRVPREGPPAGRRRADIGHGAAAPVETGQAWNVAMDRLLDIIRGELERPTNRRLVQVEPGSWWLADRDDRAAAALPLADRVEWAIFSLLSTSSRLGQSALLERVETMFSGHDRPDDSIVRACLESYRSPSSVPGRLHTDEVIAVRSQEHVELISLLADVGHRLRMSVWIGPRERSRVARGHRLSEWLDDREQRVRLSSIVRAPEEALEPVPCIWYIRGKVAFLFEIDWTAMLGESLLRRHARIPPDPRLVRFLVIAPERTELVRLKLARSALLRQSIEAGNWHILKSSHLRALAARPTVALDDLAPFLGLDPEVERSGRQMPLFG